MRGRGTGAGQRRGHEEEAGAEVAPGRTRGEGNGGRGGVGCARREARPLRAAGTGRAPRGRPLWGEEGFGLFPAGTGEPRKASEQDGAQVKGSRVQKHGGRSPGLGCRRGEAGQAEGSQGRKAGLGEVGTPLLTHTEASRPALCREKRECAVSEPAAGWAGVDSWFPVNPHACV